ncbi:hypothetical protein [Spiroplasma taiwanense]|uniref:Uncharacterized protein n=1 Tax=Spiroplasma taiwanense CT-1 TaxID=1276220 RepID=S5LYS7_9MOLU|nr:hypothetical protein [Spiroplasma taiwanense]AGR41696.1 hypothetical protein STAIW_v1c11130 [Spiroplasma taiwanense CT-1]
MIGYIYIVDNHQVTPASFKLEFNLLHKTLKDFMNSDVERKYLQKKYNEQISFINEFQIFWVENN